ncbi:NAD(P)H-binding protein [Rubrivirga sp.]|uniref:NAD(P)H-binding protein n=1 Tax=Rubrivirga sp. TaxID=1885344 RepID=UPI003C77F80E
MLAITTPTGHIGSALTRLLLDAGRDDLVLLVRDASKLSADVRARTETREGVLEDADYVRAATEGADALFWLSPVNWGHPDPMDWYETLGRSVVGAVEGGVGHVVHLSSEGAQDRDGHGPVSGLGRIEDALDATTAAVRHLRPTFFFENFEAQIPAIQNAGAVFFPVPETTATGMIATADIAQAAADLLLDLDWSGTETVPLLGAEDLTYADAAAVLSKALGRDVRAQQIPPQALHGQLSEMGAPKAWADAMVQLYTSIGSDAYSGDERTAASTTPTRLEDWARESLRPALENA